MKTAILLLVVSFLTACTGLSVDSYKNDKDLPNVLFKTVEVYKHNALGPSFNYVMLFACEPLDPMKCNEVQRTPTVTPGIVSSIVAPVLQAGAIVGGAVFIGEGLSKIKLNPSINPKITLPGFP